MLKYCLQPSPEEIVGAVGKIAAINTAVMLKRRGRARSLTVHSLREKCSCTLHMFAAPLEIVQSDYHVSGKKNIILCHAIRSSSLKQHIRGRQKGAHGPRAATSLDVDSLSMEVRQKKKKKNSGWICHCNNSLAEHKTVNMLRAPHCLCFSAWQERQGSWCRSSLACCQTAPLWWKIETIMLGVASFMLPLFIICLKVGPGRIWQKHNIIGVGRVYCEPPWASSQRFTEHRNKRRRKKQN